MSLIRFMLYTGPTTPLLRYCGVKPNVKLLCSKVGWMYRTLHNNNNNMYTYIVLVSAMRCSWRVAYYYYRCHLRIVVINLRRHLGVRPL